jgi:hypothetical protein
VARIQRIGAGSLRFYFGDLLPSTDLETGQKLVPMGVFPRGGAGGERRVRVLHAVRLGGFSAVCRAGSFLEQAGETLDVLAGSDDFRHLAFDIGLAICQLQVGRMMNMDPPDHDRAAAWTLVANWVARHRFATAYLIVVLSWLPLLPSLFDGGKQGDISVYENDADSVIQGKMPYRDTLVEYPPYAIPIFLLPRMFGSGDYLQGFMMLAVFCDLLIRGGLFWAGVRHTDRLRSLLPLICYCAAVPFLRFFCLQRFDLWPALICVAALLLFCRDKPRWSGLAIAIGIGVKVYPAVFVLPLFTLALRQGKGRRFVAGLIAGLGPIVLLSFVLPWWRFAQFQGDRGLQCESLVASFIWSLKRLGLADASWVWVTRWFEVQGPLASALLPCARGLFLVAVLCSVTIASLAASRCRAIRIGRLARLLLVPLLGFVAFNQVLSPQFMIWLLPLAALGTLEGNPWIVLGIPLVTAFTPVIFPSFSGNYGRGLNFLETTVMIMRNFILVAVWCLLIKEQWQIWRNGNPDFPSFSHGIS